MSSEASLQVESNVHTDVLVVGAGPVGLATAALLARDVSRSVCVLDARAAPVPSDKPDARVFALSRASQNILDATGAWSGIAVDACPYRRMCVWDSTAPFHEQAALTFDAAELGEPDLGHIVENARIERALRQSLEGLEHVRWVHGARLRSLAADTGAVTAVLDDSRRIEAKLVVGADGASSATRELAGIDVWSHDYHQRSIVTRVRTERGHADTAWQRFLATGPVALLPLADGRSCVIWSADAPLAEELLAADDADFRARLGLATEEVLGAVIDCDERLSFPLRLLHARGYCARRVVLIGDAAHVVHPLAGQGLNLGLLDAAALAQCLRGTGDPGERRVLRRYERWRKGENVLMLTALDSLQRLFAVTFPPLAQLRGAGLRLMNHLPPVRRACMRRAMGLSGDLPRVARAMPGSTAP